MPPAPGTEQLRYRVVQTIAPLAELSAILQRGTAPRIPIIGYQEMAGLDGDAFGFEQPGLFTEVRLMEVIDLTLGWDELRAAPMCCTGGERPSLPPGRISVAV
ncbi:MAG: hypothetical protein ACYDBB_25630 [Armatimonadota bacterium]